MRGDREFGVCVEDKQLRSGSHPDAAPGECVWRGVSAMPIDRNTPRPYAFIAHNEEDVMPRPANNENSRVALRVRPVDKALIMRAVTLAGTDMTGFILRTALKEAQAVIDEHELVKLTSRDSQRVLELLDHPPAPNAKLRKAARALPERS